MGAENQKDHTSHHFHKILDAAGFAHKQSTHTAGFGEQVTKHFYEHPGGHRAQVWQYHDKSKPTVIAHYKQGNGIMAPASIETKPQLQRWMDNNKIGKQEPKNESFAHPFRTLVESMTTSEPSDQALGLLTWILSDEGCSQQLYHSESRADINGIVSGAVSDYKREARVTNIDPRAIAAVERALWDNLDEIHGDGDIDAANLLRNR